MVSKAEIQLMKEVSAQHSATLTKLYFRLLESQANSTQPLGYIIVQGLSAYC